MYSNLDHDVFIQQGKAIALANQVADFIKAKGKAIALANQVADFIKAKGKVTHIPFGQSGMKVKDDGSYKTSQQTMRSIMTQSVSANRPVLKILEKSLTKEQQRHKFNAEAKQTALEEGKDHFTGRCDLHGTAEFKAYVSGKHLCIKCRKLAQKRRKEAV